MRFLTSKSIVINILLTVLVLSYFPVHANVRIMSYNIKDFWLRFDEYDPIKLLTNVLGNFLEDMS